MVVGGQTLPFASFGLFGAFFSSTLDPKGNVLAVPFTNSTAAGFTVSLFADDTVTSAYVSIAGVSVCTLGAVLPTTCLLSSAQLTAVAASQAYVVVATSSGKQLPSFLSSLTLFQSSLPCVCVRACVCVCRCVCMCLSVCLCSSSPPGNLTARLFSADSVATASPLWFPMTGGNMFPATTSGNTGTGLVVISLDLSFGIFTFTGTGEGVCSNVNSCCLACLCTCGMLV